MSTSTHNDKYIRQPSWNNTKIIQVMGRTSRCGEADPPYNSHTSLVAQSVTSYGRQMIEEVNKMVNNYLDMDTLKQMTSEELRRICNNYSIAVGTDKQMRSRLVGIELELIPIDIRSKYGL